MASLKYWLWLASLPGVGGVMKNRLLEHFGGPEEVYCSDSGEYFLVEGMTRAAAARLEEKSLEEADRILVLDDGKINGFDTHEHLLENNEIYRDIYESQTQGGGDFDHAA